MGIKHARSSSETYPCPLNDIQTFLKSLSLGFWILGRHEELDWDLASFQRLQELGYDSMRLASQ